MSIAFLFLVGGVDRKTGMRNYNNVIMYQF